jgi:glycosyltransferase involved in cell wall biosynthesis
MKIGIEVQRLFRKKKFGIESSSLELIRKLQEVEPNHEYVIFAKKDEDQSCLSPSANVRIKILKGKLFADFEQFFLPLAARREQVDILHCTGNTAPYFCPVPVVQTLHDVIFMDAIPSQDTFYQRFGNHYRRRIVPLVTPKSKAVITVSQHEKERIVNRLGIDPAKIHVIYNGINENRFNIRHSANEKKAVREKYQLPHRFILFLGNPAFRKNPERAIEAYVKYATQTTHPLPLVTPGLPESFVVQKLAELNFPYNSQQFITPGWIADEHLPVLYGLATVFLFPSLSEGFGMPIVEAMACGAPVITSGISCMPEIAGDAAILVDPYKTDHIAAGILAMATDEGLRNGKIEQGLLNARRFSWDQTARKVLGLYESVYRQARTPGLVQKHVLATRD